MRSFVIPEKFFIALSEKPKLYARVWFYFLSSGYADELIEPFFLEKIEAIMPKSNLYTIDEIKEIYKYGLGLLREGNFEIVEFDKKRKKRVTQKHTPEEKQLAQRIIDYLNSKTGSRFSNNLSSNVDLVIHRIRENHTYDDFVQVINKKCDDWMNTDYAKYLRPVTLFNKNKFDTYLNIRSNGNTKTNTKFDNLVKAVNEAKRDFGIGNNE